MQKNTYAFLDSGNGKKLEQFGSFTIIRPAAGAVWKPQHHALWRQADAEYVRTSSKDGRWQMKNKKLPHQWEITHSTHRFLIKPTSFGHLGIFPEHALSWQTIANFTSQCLSKLDICTILNLFAYTGGASMAALKADAHVVHLDASKTSIAWAKENAHLNELQDKPIRYIVDDVMKFVQREQRRGHTYHGVILDPPSYGRGNKGQVWKIEKDLPQLLEYIHRILSNKCAFVFLSTHTPGYTPYVLENMLKQEFGETNNTRYEKGEMLIQTDRPDEDTMPLPSGSYSLFVHTS